MRSLLVGPALILSFVLAAVLLDGERDPSAAETASTQAASTTAVLAVDFVRTHDGEQADYLRFLELNWKKARAAAREEGFVVGFEVLVRPPAISDADPAWDVMLITEYRDAEAFDRREELFAALFERPELALVEIDGKGPRDMADLLEGGLRARRVIED